MSQDTIIFKGDMFFRPCGMPVANIGSLTTTCLKRKEHPGLIHEDFDGRRRHEIFGADVAILEIPSPRHMPDFTMVTREMVEAAYNAFVKPTQDAQDEQSTEILTLAAVLRAVNEGLPIPVRVEEDPIKEIEGREEDEATNDLDTAVNELGGPLPRDGGISGTDDRTKPAGADEVLDHLVGDREGDDEQS